MSGKSAKAAKGKVAVGVRTIKPSDPDVDDFTREPLPEEGFARKVVKSAGSPIASPAGRPAGSPISKGAARPEKAVLIAHHFRAIVHPAEEGGYWAEVEGLSGCFTQADDLPSLKKNIRAAIALYLDDSEPVVSKGAKGKRGVKPAKGPSRR